MIIDDSDWMGGVGSPTKRKMKEIEQKKKPAPVVKKYTADDVRTVCRCSY